MKSFFVFEILEDLLLVPKDNGADAGKARGGVIELLLGVGRVALEVLADGGAEADDAHLAYEDVYKLGQLVYLCLSEEFAHRKHARVVFVGIQSAGQVRRIQEHGGELEEVEVPALAADAALAVEDVVLA